MTRISTRQQGNRIEPAFANPPQRDRGDMQGSNKVMETSLRFGYRTRSRRFGYAYPARLWLTKIGPTGATNTMPGLTTNAKGPRYG